MNWKAWKKRRSEKALRRLHAREDAGLGEGAKAAFREGELVPLKGVWFRVVEVRPLELRLAAEGLTSRQHKKAGVAR